MSNKYNDKMRDSFHSKFAVFFFVKAFNGPISDYLDAMEITKIVNEFHNFELSSDIARKYSSDYYQKKVDEFIEYGGMRLMVKDIINNLSMRCEGHDYYVNTSLLRSDVRSKLPKNQFVDVYNQLLNAYKNEFQNIFPISDFDAMRDKDICEYCGVSVDQIKKLGQSGLLHNKRSEKRGYSLEIDRKMANLEYTPKNCCMACYWCNNAKTDEFSPSEFKEIARGINNVWNNRLNSIIHFPENSSVWSSET